MFSVAVICNEIHYSSSFIVLFSCSSSYSNIVGQLESLSIVPYENCKSLVYLFLNCDIAVAILNKVCPWDDFNFFHGAVIVSNVSFFPCFSSSFPCVSLYSLHFLVHFSIVFRVSIDEMFSGILFRQETLA